MKVAADMSKLSENERIDVMGKSVMTGPASSADKPLMAGFVVESDEKADRYIQKLQAAFPGIRIIDRVSGNPAPGLILVRIAGPLR